MGKIMISPTLGSLTRCRYRARTRRLDRAGQGGTRSWFGGLQNEYRGVGMAPQPALLFTLISRNTYLGSVQDESVC